MPKILEIDPSDLQKLADVELRELIGRLCEAEFRKHSLLVSDVFWGGDQNASDGGIDVYVNSSIEIPPLEFIPKRETAFQVKKSKMPRGEIIKEMKPNGILRPEITSLDKKGAYIIVSARDLTSKKSLEDRKTAMRQGLEGLAIEVDFLDQSRIAQWISCHPSILVWTRAKIGKTVKGWRSWGNWCNVKNGVENAYLLDDNTRFIHVSESRDQLPVLAGIQKIRQELSKPGGSARLVGLSGTGKTRFAQALFEEEIGTEALNKHQVLYTDLSDSPDPIPTEMLAYLGREDHQTILVVDNCNSSLHRKLVAVAVSSSNNVSFLTIEYDIQDDIPEETEVFKLEPSSDDLIETLVLSRNHNISRIDARTIARMSGGNARLGIALANTVKRGESLSDFTDKDLFSRLFHQGQNENKDLQKSAEALSLLYSINIENADQENSELSIVGKLIKKDGVELYRHLAELCERELAQSRGNWRAILPHALANQLAKDALKKYPKQILLNTFDPSVSPRLALSFSRRLSYLHDSEVAVKIADNWLSTNGWLGKKSQFLPEDLTIIRNIASVVPDKTLEFYERIALRNPERTNTLLCIGEEYLITNTIINLAYYKDFFERAINLLIPFVLKDIAHNRNSAKYQLETLFHFYLSGTHATVEDRIDVVKKLLKSGNNNRISLAFVLLRSLLKCTHFAALNTDYFGARIRDYGYHPRTFEEVTYWYSQIAETCIHLMDGDCEFATSIKGILGESLTALILTEMRQIKLVEDICNKVRSVSFWPEAWISIHEAIENGKDNLDDSDLAILINLRNILEPKDLLEKIKGFVLYPHAWDHLLDQSILLADKSSKYNRKVGAFIQLGKEVASNEKVLQEALILIINHDSERTLWFSQGIYHGSREPFLVWRQVEDCLSLYWSENPNTSVLRGFLRAAFEVDPSTTELLLCRLIQNNILSSKYIFFQQEVPLNSSGLERLYYCLENNLVPIEDYRLLGMRFICDHLLELNFVDFLTKLSSKEKGDIVSIGIIFDYINGQNSIENTKQSVCSPLLYLAQDILISFNWGSERRLDDEFFFDVGGLIRNFSEDRDKEKIIFFVDRWLDGAVHNCTLISSFHRNYVIEALFKVAPFIVLQSLVNFSLDLDWKRREILDSNPFNVAIRGLDEKGLIEWARSGTTDRIYFLVKFFPMFKMNSFGSLEWRDIFWNFLESNDDIPKFLSVVKDSLDSPGSIANTSRASLLELRLPLLEELFGHPRQDVRSWSETTYQDFIEYVKRAREFEQSRSQIEDEAFE